MAVLDLNNALPPMLNDRTGLGKTGKAYVISKKQRYLIPPKGELSLAQCRIPQLPSSTKEYIDHKGTTVIGMQARISNLGWMIVVEIDRDEQLDWLGILKMRTVITAWIGYYMPFTK